MIGKGGRKLEFFDIILEDESLSCGCDDHCGSDRWGCDSCSCDIDK